MLLSGQISANETFGCQARTLACRAPITSWRQRLVSISVRLILETEGGQAAETEQRRIVPNYHWSLPPQQLPLMTTMNADHAWQPYLETARRMASRQSSDSRFGAMRDMEVNGIVMESVGLGIALDLASRFPTPSRQQRPMLMKSNSCFVVGFELHHMWMLADKGIAKRRMSTYGNLRIPVPLASLFVIAPTASIECRKKETRMGSLHVLFVVWRIRVGNNRVSVETRGEARHSAERWIEIVREIKVLLKKWAGVLGTRAAEVINARLLQWASFAAITGIRFVWTMGVLDLGYRMH
eukprot:6195467-Pleurochrysis_carterae.AAC.2